MPFKKVAWVTGAQYWSLDLLGDPIPHNWRPMTSRERGLLRQQLDDWLRSKVIVPATYGFPHQLVFAWRKNGRVRVCGDFRPLNDKTGDFDWPLPRLQDVRHRVRGYTWFAGIDLKDAFHRLGIPEPLRRYVAITTPWGYYQFTRMPFGLKTAPAYFQRYLDSILHEYAHWALWYQDDILILGNTKAQVRQRQRLVAKKLQEHGNHINWEKSTEPAKEVTWCGMRIHGDGILAGDPLSKSIEVPYSKKDRQSALGWLNYFREHIPNLSYYTEKVTPNKHNMVRSEEYEQDWSDLMQQCGEAVDLHHWDDNADADAYVDASNYAMGGMLVQKGKIIALWSKKLSPAQTRYDTTDRESLALATMAERFRIFLHRSTGKTTVHTDHMAILNRNWSELRPIQVRWAQRIKRWVSNLEFIPGNLNPADFMSRKGGGETR